MTDRIVDEMVAAARARGVPEKQLAEIRASTIERRKKDGDLCDERLRAHFPRKSNEQGAAE